MAKDKHKQKARKEAGTQRGWDKKELADLGAKSPQNIGHLFFSRPSQEPEASGTTGPSPAPKPAMTQTLTAPATRDERSQPDKLNDATKNNHALEASGGQDVISAKGEFALLLLFKPLSQPHFNIYNNHARLQDGRFHTRSLLAIAIYTHYSFHSATSTLNCQWPTHRLLERSEPKVLIPEWQTVAMRHS